MPGQVWIDTGYKQPQELRAERGQFHTKLVLAELHDDQRVLIVGSHNWTQNALEGHNLEAGVIFHCREQDPVVQKAREHIEACIAESQPFDAAQMRFYQTVQRDLHVNLAAGDRANFPGFEPFEALVIHAEDAVPNGAPAGLRLFVPARDRHTASFFTNDRPVQLFLYRLGALHGERPPTAQAVLYDGSVTMVNATRDAPVGQRPANCQVNDLRRPVLDALGGNVPAPSGEVSQIVVRLERRAPEDLPIYHALAGWPKLKLTIDYQQRTLDQLTARGARDRPAELENATTVGKQAGTGETFWIPERLVVSGAVAVPSRDLYRAPIERELRAALYGSDFWTESEDAEQDLIRDAPERIYLSPFVYTVAYRMTRETRERAQQQLKLFRTR